VAQAKMTARAALLRHTDLRGWASTAPPRKPPQLTCGAFNPDMTGITPLAAVASRTYRQSSEGPFASEAVYVFASSAQERKFWDRVVRPRLLACVADSLVAGSGHGVTFTVDRKHLQSVPKIGDRDREYRVVGTATVQLGSDTVYLDALLVARGSAVAEFSFTNFFSPVPWSLQSRLARAVERRMPAS
jgi:hypothetical protein